MAPELLIVQLNEKKTALSYKNKSKFRKLAQFLLKTLGVDVNHLCELFGRRVARVHCTGMITQLFLYKRQAQKIVQTR